MPRSAIVSSTHNGLVAALAAAYDLHIAPHGAQEVHVHLITAISNGLMLEVYRETVDPLRGQIFQEPLKLDAEGYVSAPDRPGLGVVPSSSTAPRCLSPCSPCVDVTWG